MKSSNLTQSFGVILGVVFLSATAVHADGHGGESKTVLLPVLNDEEYIAEPTISLIGGALQVDQDDVDAGTAIGAEISINCPLLTTPTNRIRQRLSIATSDEDGVEFTSLELNPHYMLRVNSNFEIGAGPGVGLINADTTGGNDVLYGFNVGASADYRNGRFYAGADIRFQATTDAEIGDSDTDFNNTRVLFKLGLDL